MAQQFTIDAKVAEASHRVVGARVYVDHQIGPSRYTRHFGTIVGVTRDQVIADFDNGRTGQYSAGWFTSLHHADRNASGSALVTH